MLTDIVNYIKSSKVINSFSLQPLSLIILACCIVNIWLLLVSRGEKSSQVTVSTEVKGVMLSNAASDEKIYVDIAGAVVDPGVYAFERNKLYVDAVDAAGGLHVFANVAYISKFINLAAPLETNTKLYIPFNWDVVPAQVETASPNSETNFINRINDVAGSETVSESEPVHMAKINVNMASSSELESLPGIGIVLAQRIEDARPFISISDLQERARLSDSVINKIEGLVSF